MFTSYMYYSHDFIIFEKYPLTNENKTSWFNPL